MRLRLRLAHRNNQVLPINYQYLISSWIYRTLSRANKEFARWLHQNGCGYGGKQYKLFTFSGLQPQRYELDKQTKTFILVTSPTVIELSFYLDEAVQHFVVGLFKDQRFELASGRFKVAFEVSSVEMLRKPDFTEEVTFRTLSPICISKDVAGEKHAQFQCPDEAGYGQLLMNNLVRKYAAMERQLIGAEETVDEFLDYRFELISKPKKKVIWVKRIGVRGYQFDFRLRAPTELLELGYYAGFGERNSAAGMGMVEIFK